MITKSKYTSCFSHRYLVASTQYGLVNFQPSILFWRQRPILRFIATFLLFHGRRMPVGTIHLQKSNTKTLRQILLQIFTQAWVGLTNSPLTLKK